MKIGTKSLLFGVHQVAWHPLTVLLAWRRLYREWPTWTQLLAIVVHDWGYWGLPNLDGAEGKAHPYRGAELAAKIVVFLQRQIWLRYPPVPRGLGWDVYCFSLFHSCYVARQLGQPTSKLYAADKVSICYDPKWLYLLRAKLSGEIKEFKSHAVASGHLRPGATDSEWFDFYRAHVCSRPDIKALL